MADLEKLLQESQSLNWSEDEMQQAAEDLHKFKDNIKKLTSKASTTAQRLRLIANTLDEARKDYIKKKIAGLATSVVGGVLTLMTGGAATPLLGYGLAFGTAGAATTFIAGRIETSINKEELQRAQKALNETIEFANTVNEIIQKWQERKEIGRLLCIFCLALHTLEMTDPVIKLLRQVILNSYPIAIEYLTRVWPKVIGAAKLAARVAKGICDDVVGALAKTGAQSADDVVGTGVKSVANASKTAGRVIMGISAVFLVFDTIQLCFTIEKLIQARGSEAAKELRIIADQLDKESSFE